MEEKAREREDVGGDGVGAGARHELHVVNERQ